MQKKLKFIIGFQSIGRKIFKGITKSCFSTKIDLEKIDKGSFFISFPQKIKKFTNLN